MVKTNSPLDSYMKYFPYETPRAVQKTGMQNLSQCLSDDGYFLLEGACGTGKTLVALTPAIEKVRDPKSKFERVFVVTNVKQQLNAFQDEIEGINEKLLKNNKEVDSVSALALVGKSDVCPYVSQKSISSASIYTRCNELREATVDMVENGTETYDSLKDNQQIQSSDGLYKYQSSIPRNNDDRQYCPYYATHLANKRDRKQTVPFDMGDKGLIRSSDLLSIAGEAGTCPHSVMGDALSEAEVIIGNYYHIFDSNTRRSFTDGLIDTNTIVVIDEGHNLVPTVRDILTRELSLSTVESAIDNAELLSLLFDFTPAEICILEELNEGTRPPHQVPDAVKEKLSTCGEYLEQNKQSLVSQIDSYTDIVRYVLDLNLYQLTTQYSRADVSSWRDFTTELYDTIGNVVQTELQESTQSVSSNITIPLQDPKDTRSIDKLSEWISLDTDADNIWTRYVEISQFISNGVATLYDSANTDASPPASAASMAEFMFDWKEKDPIQYFRSIQLDRSMAVSSRQTFEWQDDHSATLELFNCIPREYIADILSEFGSGVIMSATLEPIDVYRDVTGVDILADDGETIAVEQFGLQFPQDNRFRGVVDLQKFKYSNKKHPFIDSAEETPNTENNTRQQYLSAVTSVIHTTPGNILLVLPNYTEAKWLHQVLLTADISRSCFLDESSTNTETQAMKQNFFDCDAGIMITSAHGTLTEGVDYQGDKLSAVMCLGVPIQNIASDRSKAIQTAYEHTFGGQVGFEYAFTIPAVRKTRQALGRVIRTDNDIGVTLLCDERFTEPQVPSEADIDIETVYERVTDTNQSWGTLINKFEIDNSQWDNVHRHLSIQERAEFMTITESNLTDELTAFWTSTSNVDTPSTSS